MHQRMKGGMALIGRRSLLAAVAMSAALAVVAARPADAAINIAEACKSATGWNQIVEEAGREGEFLLYSTRSEADNQRVLDGFMAKYPKIKARAVRLIGSRLNERVEQEHKAGVPSADAIIFTDPDWIDAKSKAGELVAPCGPSVALWEGAGQYYPVKEAPPVANEPWVLAYNTNLVKTKPTNWTSLTDDMQFVGRVGLNEVSGITVAIWCEIVDGKAGGGYFEKFAKLKPRIFPNSAPLTQSMAAGEIAWAPYSLASTIEPLKARGAPIEWIVPDGGTFMLQRNAIVHAKAPRPAAAMVFMDYVMSAEGQQLINGRRQGLTVAPKIKLDDGLDVDLKKVVVIDQSKFTSELTQKWVKKFNDLYR